MLDAQFVTPRHHTVTVILLTVILMWMSTVFNFDSFAMLLNLKNYNQFVYNLKIQLWGLG
jgi:sRNA-binding regulator protein Hfq